MESVYLNSYFCKKAPMIFGWRYSRMDQVKFFKDCLPQVLLGPFVPICATRSLIRLKLLRYFHTTEYFTLEVFGSSIFSVFSSNFTLQKVFLPDSKAVCWRCSVKKLFLKVSQNSQENTCAKVSFLIKLQTCNFIQKETLVQVFSCEFCEIC